MNLPILQSEVKTMSSIDLLELINNVRAANNEEPLRRNSFNLKIEDELEGSYYTKNVVKNQNGTESVVYELTIEQCTLIGMRESKGVRRTVLEKLKQLENHIQLPNFTDPAEAAIAWANEYKAKQALAIELKAAEPKINHYDKVVERKNLLNATQVGEKLDGMSAIILNRHLTELGVYNKSVKRGKVFSTWFIQKGYGEMKQSEAGYDQPLFTQKGQAWVIEQLTSEGVA
nr:phage regulatory protein [Moraxellaceae bacterium]